VPVCRAIRHPHQKGVTRRDVEPSNALVTPHDDKPVPKVIDFGPAKATGGGLTDQSMPTAFGGVVGTPQDTSPEKTSLNDLDIDTRSDADSLGVPMDERLAGSPPFRAAESQRAGLLDEPPLRPSCLRSPSEAPTDRLELGDLPRVLHELKPLLAAAVGRVPEVEEAVPDEGFDGRPQRQAYLDLGAMPPLPGRSNREELVLLR